MFASKKSKSIVGLEIDAGSVAATEVRANGDVQVTGYGIAPLAPGVYRGGGEVVDADALADSVKQLFTEHKLSRTVQVGIGNQRVAVRMLRLPAIEDAGELETAIRFHAQDHIPMPLEQAVLDWEVIGHTVGEAGERQIEVVVVAARRDMLEQTLGALEKAGLRPMGIDLSAFGMIRALNGAPGQGSGLGEFVEAPTVSYEDRLRAADEGMGETPQPPAPASLYANLGDITNLAIVRSGTCLFTRISGFGVEGIAQRLAERRELTVEHARQWLIHVGLEAEPAAIEGDPEIVVAARDALAEGEAKLADELRLSLEYYGAQEAAAVVEQVVLCGTGTTIPGLVERLQRDLGYPCRIARPSALGHLDDVAAARLTVPFGLALEQ